MKVYMFIKCFIRAVIDFVYQLSDVSTLIWFMIVLRYCCNIMIIGGGIK